MQCAYLRAFKRTSAVRPQIFNTLLKIYATNADKFDRIVHTVNIVTRHTAPLFGKTTVSDVKPIEDVNQEDFKAKFMDNTYIKPTSDEGKVG